MMPATQLTRLNYLYHKRQTSENWRKRPKIDKGRAKLPKGIVRQIIQ